MGYTNLAEELRTVYNPVTEEIRIPDSGIRIMNTGFSSDYSSEEFLNAGDSAIIENLSFSYPVFIPPSDNGKVILLLHGLNERSWTKYLAWAYSLSLLTGSYVVMFPISFHINRSPESWKDPRAMTGLIKERNRNRGDDRLRTFANIAISERLTDDPRRFMNSGYQTVRDLEDLMISIRDGKHPVVPGGSKVNIFAYSIGAFLAEIIMMADPQDLFSNSKLFMFCGGSVFSNMNGASRLIMDSEAYNRVYRYYMQDFETEIKTGKRFMKTILSSRVGLAFRSMIDFSRFRKFREKSLTVLGDRILSVSLAQDKVIPFNGIRKTLGFSSNIKTNNVEIWDFEYPYSHENPFPVYLTPVSRYVDNGFNKMITTAAGFLL